MVVGERRVIASDDSLDLVEDGDVIAILYINGEFERAQ